MSQESENIEIIISDDEKIFRKKIEKIVDKVLLKSEEEYKIIEYEKYNREFEKKIQEEGKKIYILDIEVKGNLSGIDIARRIRQRDWESVIIMVTSHTELSYEALKAQIMLLAFISKYDECEKEVEKVIRKAVIQLKNKKVMKYSSEGTTYIIRLEDVVYITKDTLERKSIIKTIYNEITVNVSLSKIKEELDERFYESHRSCIVNTDKIDRIEWKTNQIYFKNGDMIDLIARDKRRGLREQFELSS